MTCGVLAILWRSDTLVTRILPHAKRGFSPVSCTSQGVAFTAQTTVWPYLVTSCSPLTVYISTYGVQYVLRYRFLVLLCLLHTHSLPHVPATCELTVVWAVHLPFLIGL